MRTAALFAAVALGAPALAHASSGAGGGGVGQVALSLALILAAARLGGELTTRIGQPAVLGELLVGVVLGNLSLVGFHGLEPLKTDGFVERMAELGVLLLLFEIGLESTIPQMLSVGMASLRVAMLGVSAPFALGWAVGLWLLPDESPYVHAFLGATLCATSVGITARVLQELNASRSPEARVILGAAVVDDVLGLVVLSVVTGSIAAANSGGSLALGDIAWTLVRAFGFLLVSLAVGASLAPWAFSLASRLRARGALLAVSLAFCFLLSWMAAALGLAPIVGAFAAGLILEEVHYKDFVSRGEQGLEQLVHPIASFLVPVFFVLMGMRTDLRSFTEPGVLSLAAALTIAAIVGKQVCGWGVSGREVDRITIGLGMIPRGEVGLIFANIGLTLAVGGAAIVSRTTFSAMVVMVILTTFVTPPALKWRLAWLRAPQLPPL